MDYKTQIDRGIELLKLCQKLQSEKDGVDRPEPFLVDKTKTNDQFAQDVTTAITNMAALHRFIPQMQSLGKLGQKLAAEGKITVDYGDDYSEAALNFVLAEYGIT